MNSLWALSAWVHSWLIRGHGSSRNDLSRTIFSTIFLSYSKLSCIFRVETHSFASTKPSHDKDTRKTKRKKRGNFNFRILFRRKLLEKEIALEFFQALSLPAFIQLVKIHASCIASSDSQPTVGNETVYVLAMIWLLYVKCSMSVCSGRACMCELRNER